MKTSSLRRRGVVWSLVVLATLLAAVGAFVDANLGRQLRNEQRTRLVTLAGLGIALNREQLGDQALADRLAEPGVGVTVVRGTGAVVGVPQDDADSGDRTIREARARRLAASAGVRVVVRGARLSVHEELSGTRTLVLRTDRGAIDTAQRRFELLMLVGSGGGLVLAGLALWWVLGRALAPLDEMTATATAIAAGDRGRRLAPDRTDTELGRAAAAFDAMLEELEGAETRAADAREQLARFLSDASHELRTPLAGVGAGAEQLLVADLDAHSREQVAADVVREARRAARLVDDLLVASRLEDVVLERADVDVEALAASAAARSALAGPPAVEVVAPTRGPLVVRGDRMRLEQVLANLLDNARRAAPAGKIRLRLTRVTSDASTSTVRMIVSDTGPGIDPLDRERVFERLVRLDTARSRSSGGAGLGLAIARGLAQAHGGTLVCAFAEPGDLDGAVFVLDLPAAASAPPEVRGSVQGRR